MSETKRQATKAPTKAWFEAAKRDAVDVTVRDTTPVKVQPVLERIAVYCPSCGHGFNHERTVAGKTVGGLGGAVAGAALGAKIGIAAGPLGAFAGTIPGAVLGAVFGSSKGSQLDQAKCPKCSTGFDLPKAPRA